MVASRFDQAAFPQSTRRQPWTIQPLTRGPRHHFFGYYGICPWSASGRRLVCLECDVQDRMPLPGEAASIGLVDPDSGRFRKIAETRAWNLQQGAMLHWNPARGDDEIIYNDLVEADVASVALDVHTGRRRVLPGPFSALSRDGRWALSLTYGRMGRLRKVVGYGAVKDPNPDDPAPKNDGVFLVDLQTGRRTLVVSIAEVYARLAAKFPALAGDHMWFNHTVFNPSATRFFFFARAYVSPGKRRHTAMFTANRDGSDLREVVAFDRRPSHFDWRNDREILATFNLNGANRQHVLFTDGQRDYRVIGGGSLDFDGHCTFAPDGNRIATDRKVRDTLRQSLIVYDLTTDERQVICTFGMKEDKYISGNVRCDFHPRWNRTGEAICFDAIEPAGGTRQLHVASQGRRAGQ